MPQSNCKICASPTRLFAQGVVLGKYDAYYDRCESCGFMQVRDVSWLAEAYSEVIADIDIGTVDRMVECSSITKAVLHAFFDPTGQYMDFGAGYGAFVRRMRDLGYDFLWYDTHCDNLFAKRFDGDMSRRYSMITAFEVVEHLEDPVRVMSDILAITPSFLFTTELIAQKPPALGTWPYYASETGQHIAFFTEQSLQVLADRLNLHYVTDGVSLHLLSQEKVNPAKFRLVTRSPVRRVFNMFVNRPTLLYSHYEHGRRAAIGARA